MVQIRESDIDLAIRGLHILDIDTEAVLGKRNST